MREGDSKGLTERRERARGNARERGGFLGRRGGGRVVPECVDLCRVLRCACTACMHLSLWGQLVYRVHTVPVSGQLSKG